MKKRIFAAAILIATIPAAIIGHQVWLSHHSNSNGRQVPYGGPDPFASTRDLPEINENADQLRENISKALQSGNSRNFGMDQQTRNRLAKLSALEGSARTIEWFRAEAGNGNEFPLLVSAIFTGSGEPMEVLFKKVEDLNGGANVAAATALFQRILEFDDPATELQVALSGNDLSARTEALDLAVTLKFLQSTSISDSMIAMREVMSGLEGDARTAFQNAYSAGLAEAQSVAADYARGALQRDDTATARQWASLIQDPKTKGWVVESIGRVETALKQ